MRSNKFVTSLVVTVLTWGIVLGALTGAGQNKRVVHVSDALLNAIHQVESGGRLDPPDGDVATGRPSIGPLQCSEAAFKDAKAWDGTITFEWEALRGDLPKSKQVARAYLRRYGPNRATDEQLARIWNGGPRGHSKRATLVYWEKVRQHLNK